MKKTICSILFIAVAMLCYQSADGRTIEVDLKKMTRSAGKILAGKCTGVKYGFHPDYPNVKVTYVDIDLYDVIKGDKGKHIQFMQFGHGIETPLALKYREGDESVLFLYPASQYGFTSPVGGSQGKLAITINEVSGKPDFVKVLNKKRFLKGVYTKKSKAMTDSTDLTDNDSKLVKYDTFRQAVQSIINDVENDGGNK